MNDKTLEILVQGVLDGKLTEIEAERLLNAFTRAAAGVPTTTQK